MLLISIINLISRRQLKLPSYAQGGHRFGWLPAVNKRHLLQSETHRFCAGCVAPGAGAGPFAPHLTSFSFRLPFVVIPQFLMFSRHGTKVVKVAKVASNCCGTFGTFFILMQPTVHTVYTVSYTDNRQTDTDRQLQTQTDRHTDRQTHRQTSQPVCCRRPPYSHHAGGATGCNWAATGLATWITDTTTDWPTPR